MNGLSASNLAPDVSRAQLAEINLVLHLRVDLLNVLISQWNCNHRHESGDRGQADAKEGQTTERFGLRMVQLLLVFHYCLFFCFFVVVAIID